MCVTMYIIHVLVYEDVKFAFCVCCYRRMMMMSKERSETISEEFCKISAAAAIYDNVVLNHGWD